MAAERSLASTLCAFDRIDRQHAGWPGTRMPRTRGPGNRAFASFSAPSADRSCGFRTREYPHPFSAANPAFSIAHGVDDPSPTQAIELMGPGCCQRYCGASGLPTKQSPRQRDPLRGLQSGQWAWAGLGRFQRPTSRLLDSPGSDAGRQRAPRSARNPPPDSVWRWLAPESASQRQPCTEIPGTISGDGVERIPQRVFKKCFPRSIS